MISTYLFPPILSYNIIIISYITHLVSVAKIRRLWLSPCLPHYIPFQSSINDIIPCYHIINIYCNDIFYYKWLFYSIYILYSILYECLFQSIFHHPALPWMVENLDINQYNDGINHLSTGAGFRNHPQYTPKQNFWACFWHWVYQHYVPLCSHIFPSCG